MPRLPGTSNRSHPGYLASQPLRLPAGSLSQDPSTALPASHSISQHQYSSAWRGGHQIRAQPPHRDSQRKRRRDPVVGHQLLSLGALYSSQIFTTLVKDSRPKSQNGQFWSHRLDFGTKRKLSSSTFSSNHQNRAFLSSWGPKRPSSFRSKKPTRFRLPDRSPGAFTSSRTGPTSLQGRCRRSRPAWLAARTGPRAAQTKQNKTSPSQALRRPPVRDPPLSWETPHTCFGSSQSPPPTGSSSIIAAARQDGGSRPLCSPAESAIAPVGRPPTR